MVNDENNVSGRVKRYAKVSTSVGGLAARLAGERYLGVKIDRDSHARDLKNALGGLKGPLMKVAQIMATIPEALPQEYVQELTQLQSNAPAMGWAFVKRRMQAELGAGWRNKFDDFEHEAAAAASLGQVHRALVDGQQLAVKLQYPDMSSAVEADLKQLKLIFAIYHRYDKTIDPSEVLHEIAARLREELDYHQEARHIALYNAMLADEKLVHVPHVISDLSTGRLLTMSWLDGQPLMNFKDQSAEARNAIATSMFRAWYVPFYRFGVIHGDPHLGNYSVRDDYTVNLLDFGCVRVFDPPFVKGVIDLYQAVRDDDTEMAVHAYESWGFKGLTKEIIETLNMWAQFVYGPLLDDRTRRIQESSSTGIYGREVAEKVHKRLRELGGVTPPREFVFMDRAAIGLGGVFMHLDAEVNWHRMFMDLIDGFTVEEMQARQNQAMASAGLSSRDD